MANKRIYNLDDKAATTGRYIVIDVSGLDEAEKMLLSELFVLDDNDSDDITEGATNLFMTDSEKTKLTSLNAIKVADKTARNAYPEANRQIGLIFTYFDTEWKTERYEGADVLDANWQDDANWSAIGGGGSAAETTYDNTTSGLAATNVQGAVDELEAEKISGTLVPSVVTDNAIITALTNATWTEGTTSGITGTPNQITQDNNYLYRCTGENFWTRFPITHDKVEILTLVLAKKTLAEIVSEYPNAVAGQWIITTDYAYICIATNSFRQIRTSDIYITTGTHPVLTGNLLSHDFAINGWYTEAVGDEAAIKGDKYIDEANEAIYEKVTTTKWAKVL